MHEGNLAPEEIASLAASTLAYSKEDRAGYHVFSAHLGNYLKMELTRKLGREGAGEFERTSLYEAMPPYHTYAASVQGYGPRGPIFLGSFSEGGDTRVSSVPGKRIATICERLLQETIPEKKCAQVGGEPHLASLLLRARRMIKEEKYGKV